MECQTGMGKVTVEWIWYLNSSDLSLVLFFCRDTEVHALLTYVSKQLYFLLCLGCSCPAALLTDATGCLLIGVSPCTILQWTRGTSERLMLVPQPGWKYMEFITVQLNESQNLLYFIWMFSFGSDARSVQSRIMAYVVVKTSYFCFFVSVHYVDIGNWFFEVYKWMFLDL